MLLIFLTKQRIKQKIDKNLSIIKYCDKIISSVENENVAKEKQIYKLFSFLFHFFSLNREEI